MGSRGFLVFQWGDSTPPGSTGESIDTTVTFPTSFSSSSTIYSLVISPPYNSASASYACCIVHKTDITASNFKFARYKGSGHFWMATGK